MNITAKDFHIHEHVKNNIVIAQKTENYISSEAKNAFHNLWFHNEQFHSKFNPHSKADLSECEIEFEVTSQSPIRFSDTNTSILALFVFDLLKEGLEKVQISSLYTSFYSSVDSLYLVFSVFRL